MDQQKPNQAETVPPSPAPSQTRGCVCVSVRIEVRDPDGNLIGIDEKPDITTKQFAQLVQLGMLATAETITDTANATHNETTAATTGSSPKIYAGTGTTAVVFADYALATPTENVAATVNALSSNAFTVTGTITAGSNRAYGEVGLQTTVNGHNYLIAHDLTSQVWNVSSGGTLAVTYTFTFT
jgi:hypothetical protein